ncbi:aldo/keto reductase [Schaalia sp. ZJ1691]|uniref:aldo/keto reductase n=1 Tax=Schaalia sp. ZJ1691 TaxID=2709404 RepID=UPI0013EA8BEC|nr:aldo/keto reductase [Schaalia sp. ZJ1691]
MTVPNVTLNNGVTMPQLGYGVFQIPNEDTTQAVKAALETGYRGIDTAAIYGNEEGVGRAVAESDLNREDLFITSKLWVDSFDYDDALRAFDDSLAKLGTDYLDLYLIHWPVPTQGKYPEAWRALEHLYAEGRVRAVGVSNFQPEHLARLTSDSDLVPAVNQVELHPTFANTAVEEANTASGIFTEAWGPLGQGAIFTNPYLADIAAQVGRSVAQVVIRWHVQQGRIVIPKTVNPKRMEENFTVFDFELTDDHMTAIDALDTGVRGGADPETFEGK